MSPPLSHRVGKVLRELSKGEEVWRKYWQDKGKVPPPPVLGMCMEEEGEEDMPRKEALFISEVPPAVPSAAAGPSAAAAPSAAHEKMIGMSTKDCLELGGKGHQEKEDTKTPYLLPTMDELLGESWLQKRIKLKNQAKGLVVLLRALQVLQDKYKGLRLVGTLQV